MKETREVMKNLKIAASRRIGVSILFAITALLLISSGAGAKKKAVADLKQPVVWQLGDDGATGIHPVFLQAMTEAIHAVAREAGVVVCFERGELSTDAAFAALCREEFAKRSKIQGLRFQPDVRVESQHAIEIAAISLALSIDSTRKPKHLPHASLVGTQARIFAPPEYSPARRDALMAKAVYDAIVHLPEVRDWFVSLDRYPRLLIDRPPGDHPPAEPSEFALAPEPPEADTARRWYEERDRITDLLIEGELSEAKGRADALLGEPIPGELRVRVRELRDKAVAKIAENAPEPETPQPEPEPAPLPPPPQEKPLDVTFTVRVTRSGSGFRSAVEGRLRISDRDIRFKPADSQHGEGWSVSWWSLKSFGEAEGMWDIAHPLVIETKDGTKYFLAEVTRDGLYGRGKQILKFIDRGRKRI